MSIGVEHKSTGTTDWQSTKTEGLAKLAVFPSLSVYEIDWSIFLIPEVVALCLIVNLTVALSVEVEPSWLMFHRNDVPVSIDIVPTEAVGVPVIIKSGFITSFITISVAPGTDIFAAKSANNCSSSELSGAIETCVISGV